VQEDAFIKFKVQAARNQYLMFIDAALGTKEKPRPLNLDGLLDCKHLSLMATVVSNWFVSIELLAAKIKIQEAAVQHAKGWFSNFHSKHKDKSLVLMHEGLVREHLEKVVTRNLAMEETELRILQLTQVVLASYYCRKL
jgi:hypothetical protein